MNYIRIWCGKNELGEKVEITYCIDVNRYFFTINESVHSIVSFNEEEMALLLGSLGSFLHHINQPEAE